MKKNKEWKTTFQIYYELYEYLVMFFRLINTFVIFQKFVNDTLHNIINEYVMAYLNNILMFINGRFNQHKEHVK